MYETFTLKRRVIINGHYFIYLPTIWLYIYTYHNIVLANQSTETHLSRAVHNIYVFICCIIIYYKYYNAQTMYITLMVNEFDLMSLPRGLWKLPRRLHSPTKIHYFICESRYIFLVYIILYCYNQSNSTHTRAIYWRKHMLETII